MKKSELQQIIKEELQRILAEGDPYRGIKSDINETWENEKIIENDIYKFLEHSHESGGPELVKDIMNAINRAMNKSNKFLKEAAIGIDDQGYGASYYKINSDIIDTWTSTDIVKKDIKGFLQATRDVQGNPKKTNRVAGPRLTKEVMNAIMQAVKESQSLLKDKESGEPLV